MASCPVRAEQVLESHGRPLRITLSRPSDCAKYEITLDVALHFGPEDHSCAEKLNKNNDQVARETLQLFKLGPGTASSTSLGSSCPSASGTGPMHEDQRGLVLPEAFAIPAKAPSPLLPGPEPIAHAEAFFAATGADIRHGRAQAFYTVATDHIGVPPLAAFRDAESYYATLGHETVHWTRHPSRLDQSFGRKRWGDEGYAREELVALSGQSLS